MKLSIAIITIVMTLCVHAGLAGGQDYFDTQPEIDYEKLMKGFGDVPHHARMRAWWFWFEGQATKKSITQDLEAMKANGIGGAILCDNGEGHTTPGTVLFTTILAKKTSSSIVKA